MPHWIKENVLAEKYNAHNEELLFAMAAGDAGQRRIDIWLREQSLVGKVKVAVIGIMNDNHDRLDAYAKVVFIGHDTQFVQRELYINFPSDHFLAKIMLVLG